MNIGHTSLFDEIISRGNLLFAWKEFSCGKRKKKDVQVFERHLEDNIFRLHWELANGRYNHEPYFSFTICDPKQRSIRKASVRDRVLHHSIFRVLYPFYDPTLIDDSYACRNGKGSHAAVVRLSDFLQKESRNHARPAFALKCDIRKFFASINHEVLKGVLARRIKDTYLLGLLAVVIDSHHEAMGGGLMACPSGTLLPSFLPTSISMSWTYL